jgi:endonuclease/exonuclease/phosphatase family metal-dependent hydrolase
MTKLSVLTLNVRHETPEDGPDNWPFRGKLTARLIQESASWVIGTQEGRRPQIQDLLSQVEGYELADRHRFWDATRSYPSIFYRKELIEILESGDRWLSETPEIHASKSWGSTFPRLATWAKCRVTEGGITFLFANVHLDHLSAEARKGQAEVVLKLLAEVNIGKMPVILVGDFNDIPGSEPYRILTAVYKDAWLVSNHQQKEPDTWHGFSGKGLRGRLDWILTSYDIKVHRAEILRTSYHGSYPSDHFPVKALLEL